MRIIALVSSYRKNGNTARIVHMVEVHLKAFAAHCNEPLEFETLYLGHMDLQMCRGCRTCFDKGEEKCPLKDDLLSIKAKMNEADGIIVASPVYVNDVNGIAKNWIDRLGHVSHRQEFAEKCAYLIATVADGPTGHALRTLNTALRTWGFYIVGQAGFKTGALMKQDEMKIRYHEKTERIAKSLFNTIRKLSFAKPSFLSLMTFKIQQRYWQRADKNSIGYEYWKSRGWTLCWNLLLYRLMSLEESKF